MENLITLIKSLPVTLKPNKMMVFNGVIISIFMFCTNYEDIKENLFKKDLVEDFVEKTFQVENIIHLMKTSFSADEVSIAILHNGVVAVSDPKFHLMKFSVLFSVGKDARSNKVLYNDQPIALWLDSFRAMICNGYFIIEDMSKDKDPLVRRLHDNTGNKTQVFLPLHKDGFLIGFCVLSYKKKKDIEKAVVTDMKRSLEEVELLL
jgi:hypothetical protein